MTKRTLLTAFATLSLLFFACSRKLAPSADGLADKIKYVASNWSQMRSEADLSFERISSWLPEQGVRGRYQIAKQELGQSVLESMIGEKAFLSGPHAQGINVNSPREFGRYNPAFLTKLHKRLEDLFSNRILTDHVQPFYDTELKQYLRTYYLAYSAGANKREIMDGYLAAIAKEDGTASERTFLSGPSLFLQESFRDFAESIEGEGYDVYEGFVCPGFWVRRSIDGTADEFHALLTLALRTFDPGFLDQ